MSNDNGKFNRDMQQLLKEARRLINKRLPGVIKVEGLDFIHDNFDAQGFNTGSGVTKWKARKLPKGLWRKGAKTLKGGNSQQLRSTKAGAKWKRDQNRAILAKRGHLRRAWDRETKTYDSAVAFRNSLPYAEVHNEGGHSGRGSGFTMPERRMIGDSAALDNRIIRKIDDEMQRLFNP